eukprot:2217532-Karenia_brevis.AAC.1
MLAGPTALDYDTCQKDWPSKCSTPRARHNRHGRLHPCMCNTCVEVRLHGLQPTTPVSPAAPKYDTCSAKPTIR